MYITSMNKKMTESKQTKTQTFVFVVALKRAILNRSTKSRFKLSSRTRKHLLFLLCVSDFTRLSIEVIEYTRFQYFGLITVSLDVNRTHAFGHCVIFFGQQDHRPPPTSQVGRFPFAYEEKIQKHRKTLTHIGLYCGGQKGSFVGPKKYCIIPVGHGEIFQGNEPQLVCPCRVFVQCLTLVFCSESCTRGKIWGNKRTYVDLATTTFNVPDDIGTSTLIIRLFRRSHDLFNVYVTRTGRKIDDNRLGRYK